MNRISVFYEHMAEAMKQEKITLDEVCAAVKRFGFDLSLIHISEEKLGRESVLKLLGDGESMTFANYPRTSSYLPCLLYTSLTDTNGNGIMNHVFDCYEPYKGDIQQRSTGSLVVHETASPRLTACSTHRIEAACLSGRAYRFTRA